MSCIAKDAAAVATAAAESPSLHPFFPFFGNKTEEEGEKRSGSVISPHAGGETHRKE